MKPQPQPGPDAESISHTQMFPHCARGPGWGTGHRQAQRSSVTSGCLPWDVVQLQDKGLNGAPRVYFGPTLRQATG